MLTSHPTPPQPRMTIYVTGAQENARFAAFPLGETRLRARRYVRLEPKTNLCFDTAVRETWTQQKHVPAILSDLRGLDLAYVTEADKPTNAEAHVWNSVVV